MAASSTPLSVSAVYSWSLALSARVAVAQNALSTSSNFASSASTAVTAKWMCVWGGDCARRPGACPARPPRTASKVLSLLICLYTFLYLSLSLSLSISFSLSLYIYICIYVYTHTNNSNHYYHHCSRSPLPRARRRGRTPRSSRRRTSREPLASREEYSIV